MVSFSDEKNFEQHQKVNNRGLCASADEVPTVMDIKFMVVLPVVSHDIMPPHFFALHVNAAACGDPPL